VDDFDYALQRVEGEAAADRARLLSGGWRHASARAAWVRSPCWRSAAWRACTAPLSPFPPAGRGLAYEGLGEWPSALRDYNAALELASGAGLPPDPYIQNSVGNCHASLGEWRRARDAYLASADGFQRASGFRYGRSTTPRLDGAVFAASNAALMLVQLGDEAGALKEVQDVARRAPGSVDMRAALAALYWQQGREAAAEREWDFACTSITVGCRKYEDQEWLRTVR
jgi:tetratricopeptide (TPR) repeat protein